MAFSGRWRAIYRDIGKEANMLYPGGGAELYHCHSFQQSILHNFWSQCVLQFHYYNAFPPSGWGSILLSCVFQRMTRNRTKSSNKFLPWLAFCRKGCNERLWRHWPQRWCQRYDAQILHRGGRQDNGSLETHLYSPQRSVQSGQNSRFHYQDIAVPCASLDLRIGFCCSTIHQREMIVIW